MRDEPSRFPGGGGVMAVVPSEKTLGDKIGHALELSAQIKDILNINVPVNDEKNPSPSSKVENAHEGMERLIFHLTDIKREVAKI